MNRYALLSDVRDRARACLGANCAYKLLIARGRPPQECNQIGFWLGEDVVSTFEDCSDGICDGQHTFPLSIELVRICAAPQQGIAMDFKREEAESKCFYDDIDALECCFDSGSWVQVRADHSIDSIKRRRTQFDGTSQGGAFSARIVLEITADVCCDG